MKKKLKAIWMILRAKAWVCVSCEHGKKTLYIYSLSELQPKGCTATSFERGDIQVENEMYMSACLKVIANKIYDPERFLLKGSFNPIN